jgi:hypothetical protein
MKYVFNDILNRDPIQKLGNGLDGASPLCTPFILRCRNNDSMRVDLAYCKGYQRRRNIVDAVERCQSTVMMSDKLVI